jgi:negative regulator of flagellin synthesis FlgM
MVTEVKGTTSGIVNAAAQRPAAAEVASVVAPEKPGALAGENVSLTKTAAEMRDLEHAVRSAPDIDVDRVNRLRQAIAEGNYQVDDEKLAQNLLRHEMMMISGGEVGKK